MNDQVLSRIVKNNRLIAVAKGLYYCPEYKDDNQVPITQKHIKKFMLPYNALSFAVGESLYYRLKLTSKKPSNYTYYVNHIEEKTRTIQNTRFIRIHSEINDDIIMNHAIKVIKPKKRSIAFLKEILDAYSTDNTLGFYLSTTSKYYIPKWKTGS
jgi:hypothetical protein